MFPKPTPKPKKPRRFLNSKTRLKVKKKINRVRKTPVGKLKRIADKLAGDLCRSRGKCEYCGSLYKLQWAHMIRRGYHAVRWDMDNCFCLCSTCHFRFEYNRELWINWLMTTCPARYQEVFKRSQMDVKVNRVFLEAKIAELQSLSNPSTLDIDGREVKL